MIERWDGEIQGLGFTEVGRFSLGTLASKTNSYIAYFVNRTAGDFANVSIVKSAKGTQGYFEFSTSFTNGLSLDTNANRTISANATPKDILIFRFPEVRSPSQMYLIHRALIQRDAAFLTPEMPFEGEEATRITKQLGRFGPVQANAGYMELAADKKDYRLTWKGAYLMTWKLLWPVSAIRRALYRARMKQVLESLRNNGLISGIRTV